MLKNKNILITGSTGGIGAATALLFAKNKANLLLAGKDKKKLLNLKNKIIKKYKTKISMYSFDLSNYEETKIKFKEIFAQNKSIDVLINNAGILKDNLFGMISKKEIDTIINTNLLGSIQLTQLVSKLMNKENSSIINISSIVGVRGNSGQSIYSASKAGLIGFTLSLSKELALKKIRVNAITPGFVNTKMIKNIPYEKSKKLIDSISMGRIGKPDDIANVALFLASDLSTYVTGQVIGVDGGMII
tara:strand:+ start:19 stop:756 length:738 start_codon:yes stop_codon:yes gene_type:complete